jgi:hypothetical protein
VESCCELSNEPSGSIKCWELPSGCKRCGLSSGTQLHRVSLVIASCYLLVDSHHLSELDVGFEPVIPKILRVQSSGM